jgi:biopolymer transport protein ExbB/TolQ
MLAIDVVAGPIGEALVATGIGIAVAIPAVPRVQLLRGVA